ncbi:MAG TPA: hypothetical protein VGK73_10865 [Polyangiaceae bacterium]
MTQPHPLLGGRYSLERPLRSSSGGRRWMAIEAASGRLVVVAVCDTGRLSTLEPARGVKQRHLATLIDIVKEVDKSSFPSDVSLPVGAGAVVAEHVPGRTLRAVLEQGPLHPAKAVAWVLRLAEAVQVLHSAGAVHAAISPRSVIAEPVGRAIAPVLSQAIAPPLAAFCPPERLRGGAESASDDVWALCATLYATLTGKAPFRGTSRDALLRAMLGKLEPLSASGVNDPVLQEIIARGLVSDRRQRAIDLGDLQALLDGWEREPTRMPPPRTPPRPAPPRLGELVAGSRPGASREDEIVVDDSDLPDDQGNSLAPPPVVEAVEPQTMPPLPAAAPAAPAAPVAATAAAAPRQPPAAVRPVSKRISFNPFERKQAVWPWLLVAALGGGAGVYLAIVPGTRPPAKEEAPAATEPTVTRSVPPKPVVKRNADVVRNECVAEHFLPLTFENTTDFAFVCADGDFAALARRLYGLPMVDPADAGSDGGISDAGGSDAGDAGLLGDVVRLAPKAGTAAKDAGVGSGLEWYELPATAIIRKTCCPNSAPVILPETQGWCEQLQSVVRRMADDSAKSVDLAPGARSYDKAVGCLYANRVRHGYTYSGPPNAVNRSVFQQFLSRAAIISARR